MRPGNWAPARRKRSCSCTAGRKTLRDPERYRGSWRRSEHEPAWQRWRHRRSRPCSREYWAWARFEAWRTCAVWQFLVAADSHLVRNSARGRQLPLFRERAAFHGQANSEGPEPRTQASIATKSLHDSFPRFLAGQSPLQRFIGFQQPRSVWLDQIWQDAPEALDRQHCGAAIA